MKCNTALALWPLLSLTGAVAVARDSATYDAIIVGGGPSGLSALSGLARVRRNVLLIDSGEYRNDPTRHMHDVIGFDGVTPAYYRWAAREQISHYDTVTAINGTVTKIEALDNNTLFNVAATYPDGDRTVSARKVILATGLQDILPDTPGVKEAWGKGIYWCPWCDGHEHADQALGLLSGLADAPGLVREILTLNTDIIAFVNGTDTPENRAATEAGFAGWEQYLALHNVTVENRTLAGIERLADGGATGADPSLPTYPERDLFSVSFADGGSSDETTVERAAFFASFPDEQRSSVGADMGVQLYGGRLAADGTKGLVTNINGVYAIGDANSDNVTNVPHALFTGKRTAVYLHVQLGREDTAAELAANGTTVAERDVELDLRSVWESMNGQPGDLLYAGEFDQ
ncbi:sulphydryl oxidase [Xylariomycetidae sp. FL2044]|nr:sulphydryl oxidase [Xylariomycetidae sp. FL2044]